MPRSLDLILTTKRAPSTQNDSENVGVHFNTAISFKVGVACLAVRI